MSASEIVLGLLIERPDTGYQLDVRLKEKFGSAQFGRDTAAKAIKRLTGEGLVRAAERRSMAAVAGIARQQKTVHEATQEGIEHFNRWVRASVSTPPVREELHAKIALCQPEDLPRMIEVVREAEESCVLKLNGAKWRSENKRRHAGARGSWEQDIDLILTAGDAAWWNGRIKWLQDLRRHLVQMHSSYEASRPPVR